MSKGNSLFGGLFRTIFMSAILCMLFSVALVSIISIRSFSKSLSGNALDKLTQLSVEKMNLSGLS